MYVRDAVDAGFDLDNPVHRTWMWHSCRYAWPWILDRGWEQVKDLHNAGWSLRAVRELCSDYSIDFHQGRRETVAFAETHGPDWVNLVDSPAKANCVVEAHVSLYRAQAQVQAERPLVDLLEEDITIDDVVDWGRPLRGGSEGVLG